MANKHIIFLVHGMGDFKDSSWSKDCQATLRESYAAYKQISLLPFEQQFEFCPILYNDEFEALRTMWKNSATDLGAAIAGSGISNALVSQLDELCHATDKNTFLNTHVVDVLLYWLARQTAAPVRETVRQQIFARLNQLNPTEPINWSIVAHSLGTAVVHDALHEAYSAPPTAATGNLAGITRPTLLAMIANVSRLLETDIDVYLSRVRPGSPDDPTAACRWYLNAFHTWDPIPQAKAFRPATQWPSAGLNRFLVNTEIGEIEKLNVHDLNHYLRNPAVHCALFNGLLDRRAIDAASIDRARRKFAAQTPLGQTATFISQLKPFQLGEEDAVVKIIGTWAKFLSQAPL